MPATTMINTCTDEQVQPAVAQQEDEEILPMPVVETEIRYSWFYYEREDQFDELFESLNLKGQRERKL